MATLQIFCGGSNREGMLGLNNNDPAKVVTNLTRLSDKSITKVIPCRFYNFFTDGEFNKFQAAGNNWCGQSCAEHKKKSMLLQSITYFKRNKIKIQKICHNMNGEFTLVISDKGE